MDSFEFNKIAGAVLFTLLCIVALNITAEAIFTPHQPAKPGFEIAIPERGAAPAAVQPAAPEEPIEKLLASAAVYRGEAASRPCTTCHSFEKGGRTWLDPTFTASLAARAPPPPGSTTPMP